MAIGVQSVLGLCTLASTSSALGHGEVQSSASVAEETEKRKRMSSESVTG